MKLTRCILNLCHQFIKKDSSILVHGYFTVARIKAVFSSGHESLVKQRIIFRQPQVADGLSLFEEFFLLQIHHCILHWKSHQE